MWTTCTALCAGHAHGIEKFSILYADYATRDAARKAVTSCCRVEATSSLGCNLELNAPGVTKGQALLTLAETLGFSRDQVMACGDSDNDLGHAAHGGSGRGDGKRCAAYPRCGGRMHGQQYRGRRKAGNLPIYFGGKRMKKVVAIGELLIDFVPQQKGCALDEVTHFERVAGGAPANVAAAVARLGGNAAMISQVGEDAFGTHILKVLRSNGVDTSCVFRTGGPTPALRSSRWTRPATASFPFSATPRPTCFSRRGRSCRRCSRTARRCISARSIWWTGRSRRRTAGRSRWQSRPAR